MEVFMDERTSPTLENIQQAAKLSIEGVLAFCVVDDSGSVSYYGRR